MIQELLVEISNQAFAALRLRDADALEAKLNHLHHFLVDATLHADSKLVGRVNDILFSLSQSSDFQALLREKAPVSTRLDLLLDSSRITLHHLSIVSVQRPSSRPRKRQPRTAAATGSWFSKLAESDRKRRSTLSPCLKHKPPAASASKKQANKAYPIYGS